MTTEKALISIKPSIGACICSPDILVGTTFGLWNEEKRISPRGTLLDLNAAWELFVDKKTLIEDLKFDVQEHYQIEEIDGIIYYPGDVTYTLLDSEGSKTNAVFTVKANQSLAESIQWQNRSLVIYYNKTREATDEDLNSGYNIHYVTDNEGNIVINNKTGKPIIYNYVAIPLFDIFNQDEMHKLFPWFADEQHTVRLRQNLDNPNNTTEGHLGDFAITKESEVFIAKERYTPNEQNILISLQSFIQQLQEILGITPVYTNVNNIIDEEGSSTHQRVTGSNIQQLINQQSFVSAIQQINQNLGDLSQLSSTQKSSIVSSINEIIQQIADLESSQGGTSTNLGNRLTIVEEDLSQHIADKNNPHEVSAQQLEVTINDPNCQENIEFNSQYDRDLNVFSAIQELFDRLNTSENNQSGQSSLIGTAQDLLDLDNLNSIINDNAPTIIRAILNLYDWILNRYITTQEVTNLVNTYFQI